jgi:hypothetical protein
MNSERRDNRLRLLVHKLNIERKRQAQKIDILCNDLIGAQREFIKKLRIISFIANFYESLLGIVDLSTLLDAASRLIKDEIADVSVTFFLRRSDNFELHMFESETPIVLEKHRLENCFTTELFRSICRSNKLCSLDDMFAMGLEGNLAELSRISAVAVPLGRLGQSLGFILIYRCSQEQLTSEELNRVSSITCGLGHAIQSCQRQLHPVDGTNSATPKPQNRH